MFDQDMFVRCLAGAFDANIVKIGPTRRLDPQVRISEMGVASVLCGFNVHALFFSEDAGT